MVLSERTRHEVYEEAKRTWTEEAADALMEMLPPVGWADVATKRDLDTLREHMDLRFEAMDLRFEAMDLRFEAMEQRLGTHFATKDDLHREINRLILWFVPFNLGLAVAVGRLAG